MQGEFAFMAEVTASQLERKRAAVRRYMAKYRKRLTPEQREKRRELQKRYMAEYNTRMTPERREQRRAAWRRYQAKHKERIKPIRAARDRARRPWVSFVHRLRMYGLTLDQFHALSEAQDFQCWICGKEQLTVDHCHQSGKVRGLLCRTCNDGLGKFKDNSAFLTKAIQYLQE